MTRPRRRSVIVRPDSQLWACGERGFGNADNVNNDINVNNASHEKEPGD
jgi:hypothetical protein